MYMIQKEIPGQLSQLKDNKEKRGASLIYLEIFLSTTTVKMYYSGGQSATFDLVKVCTFDPLKKKSATP